MVANMLKLPADFIKVTFLSGVGGMLEFYDFLLYILFADQIEKVFFQDSSFVVFKSIIMMLIFSIAYIIRPFGGLLFGYIGDRFGRKKSFSATVILMGSCIFIMAILPGYAVLGAFAPFFFVLLRLMQGLALGGELPGAFVFLYESITERRGLAQGLFFWFSHFRFFVGRRSELFISRMVF